MRLRRHSQISLHVIPLDAGAVTGALGRFEEYRQDRPASEQEVGGSSCQRRRGPEAMSSMVMWTSLTSRPVRSWIRAVTV